MGGIRTSGGGGGANSYVYDTTGATCSGSDGDASRVLTVDNTVLTKNEVVSLDGNVLASTYYAINNLTSNTTITFTNKVWDDQPIRILYFN